MGKSIIHMKIQFYSFLVLFCLFSCIPFVLMGELFPLPAKGESKNNLPRSMGILDDDFIRILLLVFIVLLL